VEAFRRLWRRLDRDNSGSIDVTEALNSAFFSSATIKITKTVFGSIDADGSGDITMRELLPVLFPLADAAQRQDMLRLIAHLDAQEEAAREDRLAGELVGRPATATGSGTGQS
jgi:Ca2+-binding EF-hand superfamily protein